MFYTASQISDTQGKMCIKMSDFRVCEWSHFMAVSTKRGMRWHAAFPSGNAFSKTLQTSATSFILFLQTVLRTWESQPNHVQPKSHASFPTLFFFSFSQNITNKRHLFRTSQPRAVPTTPLPMITLPTCRHLNAKAGVRCTAQGKQTGVFI